MAVTRLFTPRPYDTFDPGIAGVAPILATGTDVDNTKLTAVQAAATAAGLGTLPTSAGGTAPTPTSVPLRFRGAWQANTAYQYGDVVLVVDGSGNTLVYSANLNFTSGSSFSATNWTELTYPGGSAASGGSSVTPTATKTTAYTATTGDLVPADATTAGFTVTLPTAPAVGARVGVKKIDTTANIVTVAPAAGGTIDGDTSATIESPQYGGEFEHIGSNVWYTVSVYANGGANGANGLNGAISQVQNSGTNLTVRPTLDFTGSGVVVTDDAAGSRTLVTISGGGGLLSYVEYYPASVTTYSTTSATSADVDATNLVFSFTVPASGKVIVSLNGLVNVTGSNMAWGLRAGAADVANSYMNMTYQGSGQLKHRAYYRRRFTGLTPGAVLTWKWAWRNTFGSTTQQLIVGTDASAEFDPAIMEVWSA